MESCAAGPSVINDEDDHDLSELPPGFRFHPTDEEIIMHYLYNKVVDRSFVAKAIGEADLNKCEPWDLPKKGKIGGEKEWFFFWQRDRKYPTGMRTNRATESGYWKATGKDKEIHKSDRTLVGMKKTLVFYKGRAPKGQKTNWVMHEFRLEGNYNFSRSAKDEFVVSRVFHKSSGIKRSPAGVDQVSRMDSYALPPLTNEDESLLKDDMQYDETNLFVPPQNYTNHYQHGFIPSYPQVNLSRKIEHFSCNNSMLSHSQDTGLSTDNLAANEITSKNTFDDQVLRGLSFGSNISDLDSFWDY